MRDKKYPPCGRLCDEETCEGKRLGLCEGCVEAKGSPKGCINSELAGGFQDITICPIWECCLKKNLEHCGQCKEFPCKTFLSWYDPKSGKKSILPYIGLLLIREKLGDKEWIKWIKIHKKKAEEKTEAQKISSSLMKDINRIRKFAEAQARMNTLRKYQIKLFNELTEKLIKEGKITKKELRRYMPKKKEAERKLFS